MGLHPRAALARLRAAADDGRLAALCERHGVRLLTVFGSTAREDAAPRDLDVAVGLEHGHRADLLALLDDLSELTRTDDVDLLVLDDAGPVARERALVRCVPLYESAAGVYALAQMAAMTERMDTEWLRRLDLDLLAR
jgi:predicted nucleotidyltransferase